MLEALPLVHASHVEAVSLLGDLKFVPGERIPAYEFHFGLDFRHISYLYIIVVIVSELMY